MDDLEAAIAAVKTGSYEHVRSLYPRALSLLGDLGRSLIIAAPGHTLIGADFSAIEFPHIWRGSAMMKRWKLDAYAHYDATQDPRDEPYCILACRMLHVPDGSFMPNRRAKNRKPCGFGLRLHGRSGAIEKFAPGIFDEAPSASRSRTNGVLRIRKLRTFGTRSIVRLGLLSNRGRIVHCGPVSFRTVGTSLLEAAKRS